jgi:DNA (cytosine-5)-methyltransferase 1
MLGELAGAEAADQFADNFDAKTRTGELEYFSTDPSFVWDEPARNANAHRFDRCPKGFEDHYYAAYETAARERVLELIWLFDGTWIVRTVPSFHSCRSAKSALVWICLESLPFARRSIKRKLRSEFTKRTPANDRRIRSDLVLSDRRGSRHSPRIPVFSAHYQPWLQAQRADAENGDHEVLDRAMKTRQKQAIDICAGAGGLSLGLRRAGWSVRGVERNPDAVESYHENVGRCVLSDLRDYHPLSPVDLVCGGPPCQPFSDAGLREGTAREDGRLWEEQLRIAIEGNAAAIMLENVRGFATWRDHTCKKEPPPQMQRKCNCRLFIEYVREELLRRGGYHTSWRLLNAADYGVPQKRLRVFMVGFRDVSTLARWKWPLPTNAPPGDLFFDSYRTVREVLELPSGEYLTGRREGAKGWQGERMVDVDAPAPTVGTRNNAEWIAPRTIDRPANTVCVGSKGSGGEPFANQKYRTRMQKELAEAGINEGAARMGVEQLAVLQGFPSTFRFFGNVESRCRQIGNAVPPPLGEALGERCFPRWNEGRAKG